MASPKYRAAIVAACLATLVSGATAPSMALADPGTTRPAAIAPSGFNWLANGTDLSPEEVAAIIRAQQIKMAGSMGNGSWICSPAGFGQRSRCYRN